MAVLAIANQLHRYWSHPASELPGLASIMGLIVVYASISSDLIGGLLTVVIAYLYIGYLYIQLHGSLTANDLASLRVLVITYSAAVVLIRILKRREVFKSRQLKDVEERYRSIFENAVEGIYRVNHQGRQAIVNLALARMLGYESPEQLTAAMHGDEFDIGYVGAGRQEFFKLMREQGQVSNFESEVRRRDGELIWVSETASKVVDPSGQVFYEGTVSDITKRKRAEAAEHDSQQQLQRQNRYLEALHEITLALVNRLELPDLLLGILKQASGLLDVVDAGVYLVERDHQKLRLYAGIGRLESAVGQDDEQPLVEKARSLSSIQLATDSKLSSDSQQFTPTMAVPLRSGNEVMGVIAFGQSDDASSFSVDQIGAIGRFTGVASVALDNARLFQSARMEVARRLRTEEILRRSEARFRSLTEAASDAIVSCNSDAQIIYLNRAAELIFGYQRAEAVGRSLAIFLPNSENLTGADALNRFTQQSGQSADITLKSRDGRHFPAEASIAKWDSRQTESSLAFYTLILRDVSERQESAKRFQVLIESIRDYAIYGLDRAGKIISWNSGAEKITGYSGKEAIGQHFSIFFSEDDRQANKPERELETAESQGSYEEKAWRSRKDGTRFFADVSITALRDPGGNLSGFSKVIRDISEPHRLDQMKSDFIAMVSHQLKTPVALIRGYTENMLTGVTGRLNQQQRQYLTDILEISAKNYGLITDLLNLSRIERGVVSYAVKPVSLSELAQMALRNYRQRLETNGLELRLIDESKGALVLADAFKTAEAVGNTIDNAIKFTKQGFIEVSLSVDQALGRVRISDSGPGMDTEIMSKLFKRDEAFTGTPLPESHSGLGLYIAKEFINAQGGDIQVSSIIGQGSQFTFSLPLAKVNSKKVTTSGQLKV